jgi:hypothetical protein
MDEGSVPANSVSCTQATNVHPRLSAYQDCG